MHFVLILGDYSNFGRWFDECLVSLSSHMECNDHLHIIDCSELDKLKIEDSLRKLLPNPDDDLKMDYIPCLGTYDVASVLKDLHTRIDSYISTIVASPSELRNHIPRDIEYKSVVDIPGGDHLIPNTDEESNAMDRVVHFFWSGPNFPYVNRLAVETALKVHQPGRVFVWYYEEPSSSEKWEYIKNLDGVDVVSIEDVYKEDQIDGFDNYFESVSSHLSDHRSFAYEAQMKDYFMWHILEDMGGLFLDMDTLSYKPIWDELDQMDPGQLALSGSKRVGATGLLAYNKPPDADAGVIDHIKVALDDSMKSVIAEEDKHLNEWNYWTLLGPTLIRKCNDLEDEKFSDHIVELPGSWCYPWVSDADYVFTGGVEAGDLDELKILHYYQSGRQEMGCKVKPGDVDEEYVDTVDSPYSRIVREVIKGDSTVPVKEVGDETMTISKDDVKKDIDHPLITASMVLGDPPLDKLARCLWRAEPIVDQFIFAYNGEAEATINMIESLLHSKGMSEIPDDTPDASGYKIYNVEWEGYRKSRNEALGLANKHMGESEYILKLDSDEYLVGGRNLRAMLKATNPDVVDTFCYGESRFKFHRAWHKYTDARFVGRYHEIPMFSHASDIILMDPGLSEDDDPFSAVSSTGTYAIHDSDPNSEEKEELGVALLRQDISETKRTDTIVPRQYFYAGRDIMRVGRLEESEHWFNERLRIWDKDEDPRLVERFFTFLYLGHNLRDQERYNDAASSYASAASLFPQAREGWYYLITVVQDELREEMAGEGEGEGDGEEYLDTLIILLRAGITADTLPGDMPMFVQTELYTQEVTVNMAIELADVVMSRDSSPEIASMVYSTLIGLEGANEEQQEGLESRRASLKNIVVEGYKDLLPALVEDLKVE